MLEEIVKFGLRLVRPCTHEGQREWGKKMFGEKMDYFVFKFVDSDELNNDDSEMLDMVVKDEIGEHIWCKKQVKIWYRWKQARKVKSLSDLCKDKIWKSLIGLDRKEEEIEKDLEDCGLNMYLVDFLKANRIKYYDDY